MIVKSSFFFAAILVVSVVLWAYKLVNEAAQRQGYEIALRESVAFHKPL
jgi:hypothetical protein